MTLFRGVLFSLAVAGASVLAGAGALAQSRGYLTTPQELTVIKQKADQDIEPYATAVAEVLSQASRSWDFALEANTTCNNSDDPLWSDNQGGMPILYAKALAYHLTGETRYAEEVKGILQRIMTEVLTISITENQCQLNFGWATPEMVASADLIEDYWKNQTCTGPTSTVYGQNAIGSGNCKVLFQNWLVKNPYYVTSYDANTGKWGNWEAATTNATLYVADYLADRPSAQLVARNPYGANFVFPPPQAYQRSKDLLLAAMSMHVITAKTIGKCDALSGSYQSPDWPPVKGGITEEGIIPEDAQREEYCNIPHYNGTYQNYPEINLGNLIQQCELMRRRGDNSCFDNVDTTDVPDYTYTGYDGEARTTHLYPGRGSLERAIDAIIIDAGTEWRRSGALWVAYRYYFNNKRLPETDLARWSSWLEMRAGDCGQDICFGGLTHGFAPGEDPGGTPGSGPSVILSHVNLTFAAQVVGTTSPPLRVTLTNTGGSALTISSIAASGDFDQSHTCGTSVPAGASCTISVTFNPGATGKRNGTLTITDNAPTSPHIVGLMGLGIDFSLAPSSGSNATAEVTAGQTATYKLTLAPSGFSGSVSLTCAGAPRAADCTVSPASTTLDGSTALEVGVSVKTTAGVISSRLPIGWPPGMQRPSGLCLLPWLLVFALIATLSMTARSRRGWGLKLALLSLLLSSACGGGGGVAALSARGGTPAGTYTLTVTATSGDVTHSTTLTLKVN